MFDDSIPAASAPTPTECDEALAELFAERLLELARRPGLPRLVAMQMAGLASTPPTQEERAAAFGVSVGKLAKIEARALQRLRYRFPDLREELRDTRPRARSCKG